MFKHRKKESNSSLITYKYHAYLTDLQQYKAENWLYILCNFYNESIEERKNHYKETGKSLSYKAQQSSLPKKKTVYHDLKLVYSQVLQDCLQRVDKAYQKFFSDLERKKQGKKIKVGFPKKKKVANYNSFTYPQVWMGEGKVITLERINDKFALIKLPRFGKVKIRMHREIDWAQAKTVTLKRTETNRWFVCITVEKPLCPVLQNNGKAVGVDVGLKSFIAVSDGTIIEHPKFIKKTEQKIKFLQRKLSRKQKGSNNYYKQKIKLAKAYEKLVNQRKDFLHKLSLWLVMNYTYLYFEKLNVKGMTKNHRLAKSIYDSAWNRLLQYVTYKSVMLRGILVATVPPNGTTILCSNCGARVGKTLSDRIHICPYCGFATDRDVNAALNILKVGQELSEPNACGDQATTAETFQQQVWSLKQEAPSVREE